MKNLLKIFALLFSLSILFFSYSCQNQELTKPITNTEKNNKTFIFPEKGAYTGAYIDFGDGEDNVTFEAMLDFEKLVGKHQAIIASSSYWGENTFPMDNCKLIHNYGAIPLIYWSPWDRPYQQERGIDKKYNFASILEGKWDAYIDMWADEANKFSHPILVAFAIEMNGHWFPWSGVLYGGGEKININGKTTYKGTDTFIKAYKYVVDRARKRTKNILWGFHTNNGPSPAEPWNVFANYYPGDEYVDWTGLSVYGQQFPGQGWLKWPDMIDKGYNEMIKLAPNKPLILAELGVGEFPQNGDKAEWLKEAYGSFQTRYTLVKGVVYWHERWENSDGSISNIRVNSSLKSLNVFREIMKDNYWIDKPLFK
jgi:hypothetical protein